MASKLRVQKDGTVLPDDTDETTRHPVDAVVGDEDPGPVPPLDQREEGYKPKVQRRVVANSPPASSRKS